MTVSGVSNKPIRQANPPAAQKPAEESENLGISQDNNIGSETSPALPETQLYQLDLQEVKPDKTTTCINNETLANNVEQIKLELLREAIKKDNADFIQALTDEEISGYGLSMAENLNITILKQINYMQGTGINVNGVNIRMFQADDPHLTTLLTQVPNKRIVFDNNTEDVLIRSYTCDRVQYSGEHGINLDPYSPHLELDPKSIDILEKLLFSYAKYYFKNGNLSNLEVLQTICTLSLQEKLDFFEKFTMSSVHYDLALLNDYYGRPFFNLLPIYKIKIEGTSLRGVCYLYSAILSDIVAIYKYLTDGTDKRLPDGTSNDCLEDLQMKNVYAFCKGGKVSAKDRTILGYHAWNEWCIFLSGNKAIFIPVDLTSADTDRNYLILFKTSNYRWGRNDTPKWINAFNTYCYSETFLINTLIDYISEIKTNPAFLENMRPSNTLIDLFRKSATPDNAMQITLLATCYRAHLSFYLEAFALFEIAFQNEDIGKRSDVLFEMVQCIANMNGEGLINTPELKEKCLMYLDLILKDCSLSIQNWAMEIKKGIETATLQK